MTPEIKQMKTWDEAEKWLAKHGWGMEQIREQKELWDSASITAKPVISVNTTTASKPAKTTTIKKPTAK